MKGKSMTEEVQPHDQVPPEFAADPESKLTEINEQEMV